MVFYFTFMAFLGMFAILRLPRSHIYFPIILILGLFGGLHATSGDRHGYLLDIKNIAALNHFPYPGLDSQFGVEYFHTLLAYISSISFKPVLFISYSLAMSFLAYLVTRNAKYPFSFLFSYYCFAFYPLQTWYIRIGLAFWLFIYGILIFYSSKSSSLKVSPPLSFKQNSNLSLVLFASITILSSILFHSSFIAFIPLLLICRPFQKWQSFVLVSLSILLLVYTQGFYQFAGSLISYYVYVKTHYDVLDLSSPIYTRLFFIMSVFVLLASSYFVFHKSGNFSPYSLLCLKLCYICSAISIVFPAIVGPIANSSRVWTAFSVSFPFLILALDNSENLFRDRFTRDVVIAPLMLISVFYSFYWYFSPFNFNLYGEYSIWRIF